MSAPSPSCLPLGGNRRCPPAPSRPGRRLGAGLALLLGLQTVDAGADAAANAASDAQAPAAVEEVIVRAARRDAALADLDRSGAVRRLELPAGVETATEALRQAPGVFFQQTTPGQSTPILRGLRGSQVLHLVDGMRLNNAIFRDAPTQYLALVPVEGLAAVEVLPGPAPALYGADALGGVVNLRSRMPSFSDGGVAVGARVGAGVSSADLRRTLGMGVELRGERAAVAIGYADRHFGNRRTGGGERLTATGYQAHSAYLNSQFALAPQHRLEVSGQWVEQPSTPRFDELVAGFGQTAPASERFLFAPNTRAMARLGYRWRSAPRPERELRIDLARQRIVDDRLTRDTGADSTTLEANRSTLDGLVVQFSDAEPGLGRLVTGIEIYADRVDSARAERSDTGALVSRTPRFGDGARMRSTAIFAVPEWSPPWIAERALSITAGLRASRFRIEVPASPGVDAVNLELNQVTARLGLRWQVAEGLALFGSYGRGFRPPNIFDLGTLGARPGNRFNVGNPDLGPETLDNVEMGLRLRLGEVAIEATVFAADYADRIRSADTGATTGSGRDIVRSINGGTSRYRGVELQLRWRLATDTRLEAMVNAVRGEDDFAGATTPGDRIPPLNGRLGLHQTLTSDLVATLGCAWAAAQDRLSARDVRDPRIDPNGTDAWISCDASFAWRMHEHGDLRLELGNLMDARYREHGSGLDAPGRYLSLAVDWSI